MYFYWQLLGINPYKEYKNKSSSELTTRMIRTMRATGNIAPTYKRNVTLLVKSILHHCHYNHDIMSAYTLHIYTEKVHTREAY